MEFIATNKGGKKIMYEGYVCVVDKRRELKFTGDVRNGGSALAELLQMATQYRLRKIILTHLI